MNSHVKGIGVGQIGGGGGKAEGVTNEHVVWRGVCEMNTNIHVPGESSERRNGGRGIKNLEGFRRHIPTGVMAPVSSSQPRGFLWGARQGGEQLTNGFRVWLQVNEK